MRVLVCGGRDYSNTLTVWSQLDKLQCLHGPLTVIQGGASGADRLAREWCDQVASVRMINEPADWGAHGKAAGPIRNQRMIDEQKPDLVLAFLGGRGTEDMKRRARAAGIKIIEVAE